MNFYLKQKVFSWRDKFEVYDVSGRPLYYAEGEIFSLGKHLRLYDLSGRAAAAIDQQLFRLRATFDVSRCGRALAVVRKVWSLFCEDYEIEGIGWYVHGDVFGHDYVLSGADGRILARIHKQWLAWGDTYEIAVENGADEVSVLAIVLAIDATLDD
jgi:yxjI